MSPTKIKFTVGKKYIRNKVVRECIAVYDNSNVVFGPGREPHEFPVISTITFACGNYKEYKPPVVHTAHVYFWRNPFFGDKVFKTVLDEEPKEWMKDTEVLNHQVVTWTEEQVS